MASFDIHSLFTNIPLDETINICVDLVFHKKKKVKCMLRQHFKQLRTLSVKSTNFLFNKYHLKLKETILILKLKQSFNSAKKSIPLYLCENDS